MNNGQYHIQHIKVERVYPASTQQPSLPAQRSAPVQPVFLKPAHRSDPAHPSLLPYPLRFPLRSRALALAYRCVFSRDFKLMRLCYVHVMLEVLFLNRQELKEDENDK